MTEVKKARVIIDMAGGIQTAEVDSYRGGGLVQWSED
jgi:hypothetical protein